MRLSKTSSAFSPLALVAEVGAAVLGGVIVGVLLYFGLGYLLLGAGLGMGLLSIQVFGVVIGFGIGAGAGTGLAGRLLGQTGNTWLAMLAGAVTGVVVILGMRLLNVGGLGGILGVGIALVLAAAILAYNLSRRG